MVAGGGGFDFVICDELKRGSSSPCKTYMAIHALYRTQNMESSWWQISKFGR